ncbi:MAG: type IX secretion system membrane protein PorP/SprF, partial [Pedobacter sp.]
MLLLQSLLSQGQQRPQHTQYVLNNYLLNPAISGIENYIDVKAGHRNQWTGFEGAPVTNYFSIHAPIGKEDVKSTATSFDGQEGNPLNWSYVPSYQASGPHHGIGLLAYTDKSGPISTTDISVSYAYHLGLASNLNLSVGLGAGISGISINKNKIVLGTEADNAIDQLAGNEFKPDISAGLWLYGTNYFFGLSGQQLLSGLSESGSILFRRVPHFFLTTGYKFFLDDAISILPSIMVKKAQGAPYSMDVNLKALFKERFWLGSGYRNQESFNAMAGVYLNHFFNVGYSYDFTTGNISSVTKGSHEIVLGLQLNN